ncbi:antitoxin Xre/MbcA/ParS toxin-binding domain-containing protein [Sphingomonas hengshuiensis]|uniref:antitoxin Xre/MbcA/ParS toxin-binding domain-containing protein n=1 Tax=Sphingomonas hengshuiensis TaxID=1609977 RepID=UPI000AF5AA46|nr:antitoxin Xre/MbcA/ParS toxin-binding domain-containing protein [Sphingomonas hengshuiensis]
MSEDVPASEDLPVEAVAAPVAETNEKPQFKRFRKRFDTVRLTPDAAQRQGKAATLAWEAFRDRDKVVAFLNTHDDTLGGRPIDLVVESAEGFDRVVQALDAHSAAAR